MRRAAFGAAAQRLTSPQRENHQQQRPERITDSGSRRRFHLRQSEAEIAAGVTPTNQSYLPGDVRRYGADPAGSTNSTTAFQNAINANGLVQVPDGTYLLSVGSLSLSVGVAIVLSHGAIITVSASSPSYIFNCLGRNSISGGRFVCSSDYAVVANIVGGVADVSLTDLNCSGCRILYATTSASSYSAATDLNSPSQVRVSDCVATAAAVSTTIGAIFLGYCRDSAVWSNRIYSHYRGITWWGIDSAVDGTSITAARKCRNLQVFGNYVGSVLNGALWGSMGFKVSVTGNTVDGAGDVGIDFEGCVNCTASGNTVSDCVNGCLATFFYNAGIVFSGNACTVSNEAYPLLCLYNVSQAVDNNIDIQIDGDSFTCTSGRVGSVSTSGPYRTLTFTGNTLRNVRVGLTSNNLHLINIAGNSLSFDANPGSADIATAESGGNAAASGHDVIAGNILGSSSYMRFESGARPSTVKLVDNYGGNGSAYPGTIPTSGRWDAGQVVWFAAPFAGAAPGAVCVSSGVPGTWKNMAGLST